MQVTNLLDLVDAAPRVVVAEAVMAETVALAAIL
jgi:hypothetical protein